jgi:hypothetical protein
MYSRLQYSFCTDCLQMESMPTLYNLSRTCPVHRNSLTSSKRTYGSCPPNQDNSGSESTKRVLSSIAGPVPGSRCFYVISGSRIQPVFSENLVTIIIFGFQIQLNWLSFFLTFISPNGGPTISYFYEKHRRRIKELLCTTLMYRIIRTLGSMMYIKLAEFNLRYRHELQANIIHRAVN